MFVVCFDKGALSETKTHSVDLPANMAFEIDSINVQALTTAGDPQVTVGSTKGGAERVAAVTLTDALGDLTIIAGQDTVAAGGIISVTIANDGAGDTYDNATVTVYGHVSALPASLAERSANHY
jgi:hypothetical protein